MKKEMVFFFFIVSAHYTPVWLEVHAWESFLKIVDRIDAVMYKGPDEELTLFL